jgi:hypothetical protein
MSISLPPKAGNEFKFNPENFKQATDALTLEDADLRYLRLTGGSISGSLVIGGNLDIQTLSVNGGSALDLSGLSYITGITAGIASGSKAVVLNSNLDIVGINNITTTGLISSGYTNNTATLQTYQQWTNTIGTPITVELDISNVGASIGTTTGHPFRLISNNIERVRVNATTGNVSIGNTFDTYKLDVSGTTMTTSLKIRQTGSGNTDVPSFTIDTSSAAGYSGLRIAPDATNLLNLSCMGFWNSGYSILTMYVANNGTQNCVHLRPQNSADVAVSMLSTGLCVGNNAIIRGGLIVSSMPLNNSNNTVVQSKVRVIGDPSLVDGSYQKVAEFCNSLYTNTLSIQCSSTTNGPIFIGSQNASDLRFGTQNTTSMVLTTTDHLLIGTTTDAAPLTVNGTSTYTVVPFATNTYRFPISTGGSSTNLGGGPVSFSISAYFSSNILVQGGSVYTTSDRRLKRDIKPIEFDLDHYLKLEPVSYMYKNEDQPRLGLIAQDVMKVCSEMVGFSENENLKKETDDDPEDGVQYTVDYNQLSVINTAAIKLLIDRVKDLELIVAKLTSKPALAKWLSKNS